MNQLSKFYKGINKNSLVFLVAGILVGSVVVFLSLNQGTVNQENLADQLKDTLEQSTGDNLEIVNTETENGLHKIQLRNQEDQLSTYYVTKNGQLLAEESGFTNFADFRQRISAQTSFSECLTDNQVIMFGNQSQRSTVTQIQLLGGVNQISDYYADVGNEQVLRQAAQLGVRRTPAFYYNNSTIQGIQSFNQLEEFTSCQYNYSQEN